MVGLCAPWEVWSWLWGIRDGELTESMVACDDISLGCFVERREGYRYRGLVRVSSLCLLLVTARGFPFFSR